MTSNELATKLNIPSCRTAHFRVLLAKMKYEDKTLVKGIDYCLNETGSRYEYAESAIEKIEKRINKLYKKPIRKYVSSGKYRRLK